MKKSLLGLVSASLLLSSAVSAEVVIQHRTGEAPGWSEALERLRNDPELPSKTISHKIDKVERPSSAFILPFIKIDTLANGQFTLLAMRNQSGPGTTVTIDVYSPASEAQPVDSTSKVLEAREVWPVNLNTVAGNLPVDLDNFKRGWALISSAGNDFSADYFQLDPSNDFAAGGRPLDLDKGFFCREATARFLVGGGFTGGTQLAFLVDMPFGSDPDLHHPTIGISFYAEDGTPVAAMSVFTDQYLVELNAADLVPAGVNFGSMDVVFHQGLSLSAGGYFQVEYRANNRYTVGAQGVCTFGFQG